jgi:hypothetical protein
LVEEYRCKVIRHGLRHSRIGVGREDDRYVIIDKAVKRRGEPQAAAIDGDYATVKLLRTNQPYPKPL